MQKIISFLLAAICLVLSFLWYMETEKSAQIQRDLADAEQRIGLLQITVRQCRTPAAAPAQPGRDPSFPWDVLNLSEEQNAKVQEVLAGVNAELKPLSDEAQKQAAALRAAVSDGAAEDSIVKAQENMVEALEAVSQKKRELLNERLKGVLSEEQMKKLGGETKP